MEDILSKIRQFVKERDWDQFHNPKDLAIALNIEVGELLEIFLWKIWAEADVDSIREELADVLIYAMLIADKYDLDIAELIQAKIELIRYPKILRSNDEDLGNYVRNIYRVLLSRGMKGCYVYFVNPETKKYFERHIMTDGDVMLDII